MRLREFAEQDFQKSQAATLMTILQHHHSVNGDGAEIPFPQIIADMNKAGYVFNYDHFQQLLNQVPALKKMVPNSSNERIIIGQQPKENPAGKEPEDIVGGMAKRAADRAVQ